MIESTKPGLVAQSVELRTFNSEPREGDGDEARDSAAFEGGSTEREAERSGSPLRSTAASPITIEILRAKLDAAIVAEAWDAVKAIRERIVEVERAKVVDLDSRRKGAR